MIKQELHHQREQAPLPSALTETQRVSILHACTQSAGINVFKDAATFVVHHKSPDSYSITQLEPTPNGQLSQTSCSLDGFGKVNSGMVLEISSDRKRVLSTQPLPPGKAEKVADQMLLTVDRLRTRQA